MAYTREEVVFVVKWFNKFNYDVGSLHAATQFLLEDFNSNIEFRPRTFAGLYQLVLKIRDMTPDEFDDQWPRAMYSREEFDRPLVEILRQLQTSG